MFVTFYVTSCNSSGFMKLVTQLHGLCTSAAVGVGGMLSGHWFPPHVSRIRVAWWCVGHSADIISTDRIGVRPD